MSPTDTKAWSGPSRIVARREPASRYAHRPGSPPAAKGAADLGDPNPVDPEHVLQLMRANFPEKALAWVKDARWIGPVAVPTDRVDVDDEESWAASHEPKRVKHFAKRIRRGRSVRAGVSVQEPDRDKIKVIDGHHRYLGSEEAGKPFVTYIGFVDANGGPWDEAHASQFHAGDDPANKGGKSGPVAAGLAVRADDTGRVLMLQRASNPSVCTCGVPVAWDEQDGYQHKDGSVSHDDGTSVSDRVGTEYDPAAGVWEFPGGKLDDGEDPEDAARREWAEETGLNVPDGNLVGQWASSNGVYRGHVLAVPSEDSVPIHDGRDQVTNPDDPDGDQVEALAWWDTEHLLDNPAVRPELLADLDRVLPAVNAGRRAEKRFDPAQLRDHHGRWLAIADDMHARITRHAAEIAHEGRAAAGEAQFAVAIRQATRAAARARRIMEVPDPELPRHLELLKAAHAEAVKLDEGKVGDFRARHLIRWYEHGQGAAEIAWGAPGDFGRCVAIAGEHMTEEQAKGFCNLRHHGALGIYPATHAAQERHAEKKFDPAEPVPPPQARP